MSMNVAIFPCKARPEDCGGRYFSETRFELEAWCTWVLSDITANAIVIRRPIEVPWVNKTELRDLADQDHSCTWVVEAWVLKCLKFHRPEWHPARVMRSKAVSAYLNELPDDWPVVVYYI